MRRIREHVKRVIDCDGGNEYLEGLYTRERQRKVRLFVKSAEKEAKELFKHAAGWVDENQAST
jgi:hypothetical protein